MTGGSQPLVSASAVRRNEPKSLMFSPGAPLAQTTCFENSMKLGFQVYVFLDMSSGNELLPMRSMCRYLRPLEGPSGSIPYTTPQLLIKHISLGIFVLQVSCLISLRRSLNTSARLGTGFPLFRSCSEYPLAISSHHTLYLLLLHIFCRFS